MNSTLKGAQTQGCKNCTFTLRVTDGSGKTVTLRISPGQEVQVANPMLKFSLMTEDLMVDTASKTNAFEHIRKLIADGKISSILVHGRMEAEERVEFRKTIPSEHFLKPLSCERSSISRGFDDDAKFGEEEWIQRHVMRYVAENNKDDLCAILTHFQYNVPEGGWARYPYGGKEIEDKAVLAIKITTGRLDRYGRSAISWIVSIVGDKTEMESIYETLKDRAALITFLSEMIPGFERLEKIDSANPTSCFPASTANLPLERAGYPREFSDAAGRQ